MVGCDDIFGADLIAPALSTIAGPTERVGKYAVDILDAQLGKPLSAPESMVFEAHLVTRGSTGPPRSATAGN